MEIWGNGHGDGGDGKKRGIVVAICGTEKGRRRMGRAVIALLVQRRQNRTTMRALPAHMGSGI